MTRRAERAALARALEAAARRQTTPERITIFTDAQAAIERMASEEPGPRPMYAIQARKLILTLQRARPEHRHWGPMTPSPQGRPRKREGGRVGQARSRES